MAATKTGLHVLTPCAGANGEAVEKSSDLKSLSSDNELVKPDDAGWFVAVVRSCCEKRIAASIQSYLDFKHIWFESWVPVQKVPYIDRRSGKRKIKEKIFLTTFIFCHVSRTYIDEIRFRTDVFRMLTMPGHREIYQIPDDELENYRRLVENTDTLVTPQSTPLKKGKRVRIIEGNLAGVEAYVQRLSGKKAVVGGEIKFISGATIEIDRAYLEVVADK